MRTKTITKTCWNIAFIAVVLMLLYPIIFAIFTSFKSESDAYANPANLIPQAFDITGYTRLFNSLPMLRIISNTFTVSTVVTVFLLLFSFLFSYAIVFYRFKGRQVFWSIISVSLFIPFTITMIPNYILLAKAGLYDNIIGVMLPQIFSASGIFLICQSMRTVPVALIEVAKLDNVRDLKIMKDIILPLIRPQFVAAGIWFFAATWNEFIWVRLMINSKESYTLPLALQMFISGEGGDAFTSGMAMSVLTMIIPLVFYLIFQKYIIDTFTSSGIK